jgi:aminoglycoside phosphotransferase (APT) family kinase protein
MKWLAECSVTALREALQAVAPDLSGYPLTVPGPTAKEDPVWQSGATIVDERFVVKFAWSRPAAHSLLREIGALTALTAEPRVPFLPEVVASSTNPLLLITRCVPGTSLFNVVDSIDRDRAGRQLASFLAMLQQPATRERAEAAVGRLTGTEFPPATTRMLRDRFGGWVRPGQRDLVLRWCDWADAVLASPAPQVLVHGDLHGDNQVWDGDELRVVVDFATIGVAEPEYDLRTFPGPGMGPGVELLTATMRHYRQITGRRLSLRRVMAWHVRAALGDVLWRSEAGIPLADHRTPPEWVDDLAERFRALGADPETPPRPGPARLRRQAGCSSHRARSSRFMSRFVWFQTDVLALCQWRPGADDGGAAPQVPQLPASPWIVVIWTDAYRITRSSRWMTSRSYSWPSLLDSQRVERPMRPGISFAS